MWCGPCAGVPIGFLVFVLLHIPLCYWFVGMLKKRRAKKIKVCPGSACPSPSSLAPPVEGNAHKALAPPSHDTIVLGTKGKRRAVAYWITLALVA